MQKFFSFLAMSAVVLGMASCGGNDPELNKVTNGKFTVDKNGTQVQFSKGNLQATYDGSNWTWGFAEHQWVYIGDAAANNSITGDKTVSSNGTVDLFGWSTKETYYGINKSTVNSTYSGNFKDWGETIGEGWHTLSMDEWAYLFCGRTDAAHLFGMGTVNGKSGVILLPDNWAGDKFTDTDNGLADQGTYYYNSNGTNFSFHTFTAKQWSDMEANGAVFLPAAGYRGGTNVYYVGSGGYYWSATPYSNGDAYLLRFLSDGLTPQGNYYRSSGHSVRLVQYVK